MSTTGKKRALPESLVLSDDDDEVTITEKPKDVVSKPQNTTTTAPQPPPSTNQQTATPKTNHVADKVSEDNESEKTYIVKKGDFSSDESICEMKACTNR